MISRIYQRLLSVIFPLGKSRYRQLHIINGSTLIIIVSFLLFISSCGSQNKSGVGKGKATTVSAASQSYGIIKIASRPTVLNSDFPAIIQGQQNVEIRPKIDGYMQTLYVDEGAYVKKGQILFRISAPAYEQGVRTAEANVKIAQADLNAAMMQVNKVQPLVDKNIISSFELQSAKFILQSKQAALAQAQASLINARTNLGYATIYSPADGVIGLIPFKMGSLVSSTTTQPLTTVSNIQNIYAYFSINEKRELDFFKNAKGNTILQKLNVFPAVSMILPNGLVYDQKGKIESMGGLNNAGTGSVSLRATFPNPSGLIRSGSSATIRIPETIDSAIVVPQSATFQIQGKIFLYVLSSDNTVHTTAIQVNSNTASHSYIVEKGIKQGDNIVVTGISNLREGQLIKPEFMNADSVYASL